MSYTAIHSRIDEPPIEIYILKEAVSKEIQSLFVIMRQDSYFEDKNNLCEGYLLCEK